MTIRAQQRGLTREVDYSKYLEVKSGEVELKWGEGLGVDDVLNVLGIDNVQDALEGVASVVATLQSVLDVVVELIDFLVVLIGNIVLDVTEALVLVLTEVLNQVINLFSGISAHFMLHFPTTHKSRRKPSEILYDVGTAYLDNQDDKRPRMVNDVYGMALIALWSLPNLDSLKRTFDQVASNFRGAGSDFKKLEGLDYRNFSVSADWQNPVTSEGGSGMAPDFELSLDLSLVSPIKKIIDYLGSLINNLRKANSIADQIRQVLALVQQRLDAINNTVDQILSAISSVLALLAFGDANAVLLVDGYGREIDFARAIINAPLDPNYPKSKIVENVNNLFSTRGIESPIDRELGERNLYSGAALIHLQVPKADADAVNALMALGRSLFKEVKDVATTNADAQVERLTAVAERQSKINRSFN